MVTAVRLECRVTDYAYLYTPLRVYIPPINGKTFAKSNRDVVQLPYYKVIGILPSIGPDIKPAIAEP